MEGEEQFEPTYVDRRSGKEKIFSGVILILVFFAIFLGYYQLSSSINNPVKSLTDLGSSNEECIGGDCELQKQLLAILDQQQKDTDLDGLSDYDELNLYNTSPYLEDTDSDGFTDFEELNNGHDPNCPGNNICQTGFQPLDNQAIVPVFSSLPDVSDTQLDVNTIRQIFITSGMSASNIAQLTDEEIMFLFNQAVSGNEGSQLLNQVSTISPEIYAQISNLSGSQIRELLIEQGASVDELSLFSDDELKEIFLDNLESQFQPSSNQTTTSLPDDVSDLTDLSGSQIRELLIEQGAPIDLINQISDDELKRIFLESLSSELEN